MQGPFFMQGPPQAPQPHSHLVCGGCQTMLMYPQGAANVRCARCQHVTPAPPECDAGAAQLVCNGCRVLLSYPRGAPLVQCSMCHTVTQVPAYGHLVCSGCSIMLMFPMGAQTIKCSVCHSVTPAPDSEATSSQPPSSQPTTIPAVSSQPPMSQLLTSQAPSSQPPVSQPPVDPAWAEGGRQPEGEAVHGPGPAASSPQSSLCRPSTAATVDKEQGVLEQ